MEREETKALLDRHYSTIGIGDVFLEPPIPGTLPSIYLREDAGIENSKASLKPWEFVGTIKASAEDFVVREIALKGRRIEGVSEADADRNRVAHLLEPFHQECSTPHSTKNTASENSTIADTENEKECNSSTSKENGDESGVIVESSAESLSSLLQQMSTTSPPEHIEKTILDLHEKTVDFLGNSLDPPRDVVSIPLLEDTSSHLRSQLHKVIRDNYPCLLSETKALDQDTDSSKGSSRRRIAVSVDSRFFSLKEFLFDPRRDLFELYKFYKRGYEATVVSSQSLDESKDSTIIRQVELALKPGLPRELRRNVHCAIFQGSNRLLGSSTSSDYQRKHSETGEVNTTTAIVVQWSKQIGGRMSRKRKRNGKQDSKKQDNNLLFVMRKREKEHLAAIKAIASALNCRTSDIGAAGIKDMKAVTYQFCTVQGIDADMFARKQHLLVQRGIEVAPLHTVKWRLDKGDLEGNRFEIILRDLSRVVVRNSTEQFEKLECSHLDHMLDRVRRLGFVNFYGVQRVGMPGLIEIAGVRAFDIGRAIVQKDYDTAIDLLMKGRRFIRGEITEAEDILHFRDVWQRTPRVLADCWKAIPKRDSLLRERTVLHGLKRYGENQPLQALRCLHRNERIFWINAYQSYVWNQVATTRLQMYGINVVEGDLVQLEGDDLKVVDYTNSHNFDIYDVVLPLPGKDIKFPRNSVADRYKDILSSDGIGLSDFAGGEETVRGQYRKLVVSCPNIDSEVVEEESEFDVRAVKLRFDLPKGCYATSLLRELMVSTIDRNNTKIDSEHL